MRSVHFIANNTRIVDYLTTPLRVNRRRLRSRGYDVRIFTEPDERNLTCDILCLVSKAVLAHVEEKKAVISEPSPTIDFLRRARARAGKVVWFDSSDSTGVTHWELLPFVDLYLKKHLLVDLSDYQAPLYGGRVFTDYYHREFGIVDETQFAQFYPLEPEYHIKVGLSWNIGLGELAHSFTWRGRIRRRLPGLVPPSLIPRFHPASAGRPLDMFLRTSSSLAQSTISFHRQELIRRLLEIDSRRGLNSSVTTRSDGRHLSAREYRDMLRSSKITFGPFGWGELNLREYEAFFNGTMLLRPDSSHMETWPEFFTDGATCAFYGWDFGDLEEKLLYYLDHESERVTIAEAGQQAFRDAISDTGMERFSDWFVQQIELPS